MHAQQAAAREAAARATDPRGASGRARAVRRRPRHLHRRPLLYPPLRMSVTHDPVEPGPAPPRPGRDGDRQLRRLRPVRRGGAGRRAVPVLLSCQRRLEPRRVGARPLPPAARRDPRLPATGRPAARRSAGMSARMEAPVSDVGTAPRPAPLRATTVAILAMGGEGGGVLADWIVDVAERDGYVAQTTSVPGVAQRTGATIYYVELFPEAPARAAGKEPVLALMPVPGEVDVVVASELMEAGRAVERGLVTPDRTTLVASSHRVYSMTERTHPNDGRVDSEVLLDACRKAARKLVAADFSRVAAESASVISAALLGALAATGSLPFERPQFEEAVRRADIGVEASLRAFSAGYDCALQPARKEAASARQESADAIIALGVERLTDYQDAAYAEEYRQLLEPVREADLRHGRGDFQLLAETARQLALWMSYEDAIRVADLKTRRERLERVRREARPQPG